MAASHLAFLPARHSPLPSQLYPQHHLSLPVVTPVILTLPQEADYLGSAYSLPEARAGEQGQWEAALSLTWDSVTEWCLLVL